MTLMIKPTQKQTKSIENGVKFTIPEEETLNREKKVINFTCIGGN